MWAEQGSHLRVGSSGIRVFSAFLQRSVVAMMVSPLCITVFFLSNELKVYMHEEDGDRRWNVWGDMRVGCGLARACICAWEVLACWRLGPLFNGLS